MSARDPLTAGMSHRLHLRAAATSAPRLLAIWMGLTLLTACPKGAAAPEARPPTFSQRILYAEPGEDLKVRVYGGDPLLRAAIVPEPPSTAPASPLALDFEDLRLGTSRVLSIGVAPDAKPGVHRIELTSIAETVSTLFPVVVLPTDTTPRIGAVESIAAGGSHTLALKPDGTVWAWGRNNLGQLGDGTLTDRPVPVQVVGLPGPAQAVAAGDEHSLVLLRDNTVWGFGRSEENQLTPQNTSGVALVAPVLVSQPNTVVTAVAAGRGHSVVLTADGEVFAWGANDVGQTTSIVGGLRAKVQLPLQAVAIDAAGDFSLATLTDGSVWGWGDGSSGQFGALANRGPQTVAAPVAFVNGATQASCGRNHALFLASGSVLGLGDNFYSQLGDGSRQDIVARPVNVPRLLNARAIAAGSIHSLALQTDGRVSHWGGTSFGQAGIPASTTTSLGEIQLLPDRVVNLPHAASIAASTRFSLAVASSNGAVFSWGSSNAAELGDGSYRARRPTAEPVYGSGDLTQGSRQGLVLFARGKGFVSATAGGVVGLDRADCSIAQSLGYPLGTVVTLTAEPEPGSEFIGWGGNASGSNPTIQVAMDRSRNCLAKFGQPPPASFTGFVIIGTTNVEASGEVDADGCIVAYAWDVGNDGTIDGSGERFEFPTPSGSFEVRLTVTDNDGLTASSVQTLGGQTGGGGRGGGTTGNNGVVADFYHTPVEPAPGIEVTFGAYASSSPNGIITQFEWDFEDDGVVDATGEQATHTYSSLGTFRARLTVTDPLGNQATTVRSIVVSPG